MFFIYFQKNIKIKFNFCIGLKILNFLKNLRFTKLGYKFLLQNFKTRCYHYFKAFSDKTISLAKNVNKPVS